MLTGINTVNSNQEIIESYCHGYRTGCEYSKVKIIEAACEWLENNIDDYVGQIDSIVYIDSDLKENFKNYLKGVLIN